MSHTPSSVPTRAIPARSLPDTFTPQPTYGNAPQVTFLRTHMASQVAILVEQSRRRSETVIPDRYPRIRYIHRSNRFFLSIAILHPEVVLIGKWVWGYLSRHRILHPSKQIFFNDGIWLVWILVLGFGFLGSVLVF